tara:strand:- start:136 stop:510 length:375 start_codon:yes stop_codon:yes gene_type:complete
MRKISKGVQSIWNGLNDNGIALFTIIEGKGDYAGTADWVYPGCTSFTKKAIRKTLNEKCKYWRRLWWYYPKKTWFAVTKSKKRLPSKFDNFFLLGGEELNILQYKNQTFFLIVLILLEPINNIN